MLSEFKYIIFFAVLLIGVPIGVIFATATRFGEKVILFLMLFFTCRLSETINFVSHETYRGTSRGFEVGLVDLAALVMFFVIIFRKEFRLKLFPPGAWIFWIYFFFSLLSIVNSDITVYSWFEIWKMLRMYFYFLVFYNYFIDLERIKLAIMMLPALVIYIFMIAVYQKYVQHLYQIPGPLPHQNSLCMYMSVLGNIFFAVVMNHKMKSLETMLFMAIFGMSSLLVIFTLSRAGLACYVGGCIVTLIFSYLSGVNAKKILITAALGLAAFAAAMFAMKSIIKRIETAPKESRITRYNLAVSAINMANDKALGVGLNNFGLKVNRPYPYSEHFEKGKYAEDFKEGLVETVYLMVAAETGWFNLFVFIVLIMFYYFQNMFNIFRFYKREIQFIAIGIAGALSSIYIQSTLEWVLKQSCNFYQLMFVFAIVAAMSTVYKKERRAARRRAAQKA
jgi:hypothetical protein